MNWIQLITGIGCGSLGVAYLFVPNSIYHFGIDSLRKSQPEPSEPPNSILWTFRFIGICLLVVCLSYLL